MGLQRMDLGAIGSPRIPYPNVTPSPVNNREASRDSDALLSLAKLPAVVAKITEGCIPLNKTWLTSYMYKLHAGGVVSVKDLAIVDGLIRAAVDNRTIELYEEPILRSEYNALANMSNHDRTSLSTCEYLSIASAIWKLIHLDYVVPASMWEDISNTISLRKRQGQLSLDDWNQLDALLGSCIVERANADFVASRDYEALRVSPLRKNRSSKVASEEESDANAIAILDAPRAVGRYEDVDHPIEVLLTEPIIAGRLEELDRTLPAGVIKSLDLLEIQGMIKAATSERFITSSESNALTSRLNYVTEKADEGRVRILSMAFVEYAVSIYTMVYTAAVEPPREWQSLAKKIDAAWQKKTVTDAEYKSLLQLIETFEQEITNSKKRKLFSASDDLDLCRAKRTVIWRSALIEESKRIEAMQLERPSNIARAFLYKLECAYTDEIIDGEDFERLRERVRCECYKRHLKGIIGYVETNGGVTPKKRSSIQIQFTADYNINQLTEEEYRLLMAYLDKQPTVARKATPPITLHSRVSAKYHVLATWINVMIDNQMLSDTYLFPAIFSAVGDAESRGEISPLESSTLKNAINTENKVVL